VQENQNASAGEGGWNCWMLENYISVQDVGLSARPIWCLTAAQDATLWAQKFGLLLIFRASHTLAVGMVARISKMVFEILQSWVMLGCWSESVTMRESPSKMKLEKPFIVSANCCLNRVGIPNSSVIIYLEGSSWRGNPFLGGRKL
jgi:hypothetical protein